jgi:hypothetical protein
MSGKPEQSVTTRLLPKPLWWALFLVATYLMSLWFQTFKTFTLTPILSTGFAWLLVMGLLTVVIMILAYDSYVQEKGKGRIEKPARLFEWMIARRVLFPPSLRLSTQQKDALK